MYVIFATILCQLVLNVACLLLVLLVSMHMHNNVHSCEKDTCLVVCAFMSYLLVALYSVAYVLCVSGVWV